MLNWRFSCTEFVYCYLFTVPLSKMYDTMQNSTISSSHYLLLGVIYYAANLINYFNDCINIYNNHTIYTNKLNLFKSTSYNTHKKWRNEINKIHKWNQWIDLKLDCKIYAAFMSGVPFASFIFYNLTLYI